jgi:guanylate kinase
LLKKFIIKERNANNSKPEVTSGRNKEVTCKTQTEAKSRQRDRAKARKRETVRRLEDKKAELSVLVEEYERKIVLLNEEMEQVLQDRTSHIDHIKERYEEENRRQMLKMRDMRDELLWYKIQLPIAHTSDD